MNRNTRRHRALAIAGLISAGALAMAGCSTSSNAASAAKPGKVTPAAPDSPAPVLAGGAA
jgi:hypothetical protein